MTCASVCVCVCVRAWFITFAWSLHSVVGPGSKELLFLLQLVYSAELLLPEASWVSYQPQAKLLRRPVKWVPCTMDCE